MWCAQIKGTSTLPATKLHVAYRSFSSLVFPSSNLSTQEKNHFKSLRNSSPNETTKTLNKEPTSRSQYFAFCFILLHASRIQTTSVAAKLFYAGKVPVEKKKPLTR